MNKKYENFKNPLESVSLPKLNKKNFKTKKISIIKRQSRFMRSYQLHVNAIEKLEDLFRDVNLKIRLKVTRGQILETLIHEAQAIDIINLMKKDKDIDI